MAIEATATDFDQQVTGPLTVVDFWAPWCGPCKMMDPIMEKLERTYGDRIKFVRFNVDGNQDIAQRYHVMSVPSLVLFRDGQAKEKVTGVYPEAKLAHYFERKIAE
ncbi:thioredoxin [Limosilactobacillus pontis]|jgi:thioredoxin 1|uniref:Thioredoxin n=1 Tax=Limosilactobacillus pontis TaxID=35787 RepID=A0ABT7UWR1_9LACO|nr:thioredoxin [Limosilactobacillus pontis]MDM8266145.1 thioredoxin [Limosilactobacillus pontis]MDM8331968.1 thioredoxin [Limosilactobacillus pontis]HJA74564.1 thioredoxin [Candidatus Limosilactobacillus gallistercoris]